MPLQEGRLGELLVHRRLITREQLEQALEQQRLCDRPLGEILVAMDLIAEEHLERILIEQGMRRRGFWVID